MKKLLGLIVFSLLFSVGINSYSKPPDGETPAVGDVCEGLEGAEYSLCNAYCEAMDCDSLEPQASATACERVLENFLNKAGGEDPPCVDPCAGLTACPCNFEEEVPKNKHCWPTAADWVVTAGIADCALEERLPGTNFFFIGVNTGILECRIEFTGASPPCAVAILDNFSLSFAQQEGCQCQLEKYATELNNDGIPVTGGAGAGGGPPYLCP